MCFCNHLNRISIALNYNTLLVFSVVKWNYKHAFYKIHYNFRNLTILSLPPSAKWLIFFFYCKRTFIDGVVSLFCSIKWLRGIGGGSGNACIFIFIRQRLAGWFSHLMKPQISLFLIVTLQLFVVNAHTNYQNKRAAAAEAAKNGGFFFVDR